MSASQAALASLPLSLLPAALGALAAIVAIRADQAPLGLGLLLGGGVGAALSTSWVVGTLLCFRRSLGALQSATLALWPVRAGGVMAALWFASSRGLSVTATFFSLLAAHVLGLIAEARAITILAEASPRPAPAPPDARSCNSQGPD